MSVAFPISGWSQLELYSLHPPLNADCSQVDHAGQGSEHLYVADDLADGGSLKQTEILVWSTFIKTVSTWYTEESTCLQMSRGR